MQLELEEALRAYRGSLRRNESDISGFYLGFVRQKCQQLLLSHGLKWDPAAETILEYVCDNYSCSYSRISFLSVFWEVYRHELRPIEQRSDKEERLSAASYQGTGFFTWERTGSSVQERIIVG